MYAPRKNPFSSALGALMAAGLLTVATAMPDAVHAKNAPQCVGTVSGDYIPSRQ